MADPLVHYSGNRIWVEGRWAYTNPYCQAVECPQDTPAELVVPEPASALPPAPRRRVKLVERVPS